MKIIRDDIESIVKQCKEGGDVPFSPKFVSSIGKKTTFTNSLNEPINLTNHFWTKRHTSAFLILSGPSLASVNLSSVEDSGMLTMGVNNSWSVFTPDLWTCVDPPKKFLYSGWMNPQIMKFIPKTAKDKKIRWKIGEEDWITTNTRAGETPNTFLFNRNNQFNHRKFLTEYSINWGQSAKNACSLGIKSSRSVMLAAIKILYVLGIRRVYLLGCDFNMSPTHHYAFEQHRGPGAIRGNNNTYRILRKRFEALKPHFEEHGFEVYNCNPASNLEVFPHKDLDDLIHQETHHKKMDYDTKGWYEKEPKKGSDSDG